MKIGEALSLLKKEQSRLSRLISLRKENIYVEKDKKTPFNPARISDEIKIKIKVIRELKLKIQRTNLEVGVLGEKISLAEAIIKVGDIRSEIAKLSDLFETSRNLFYHEKDEREFIPQISKKIIEEEIERLETEKVILDNKIQVTNWNTELV